MRLVTFGCSNTQGVALNDSSTQAWPAVLAKMYGWTLDNQGVPGASNLEILWNILQYKFQPDDIVVVMWTIVNRDYFEGKHQFGVWQDSTLVKNWLEVHSEKDMTIRAWLCMDHANLHISRKNIMCYNVAVDYKMLANNKPTFKGRGCDQEKHLRGDGVTKRNI